MFLALLLSGAMRWDVRRPWFRYGDRFVLSAGHAAPLVYSTLAVFNEALRARFERTRDPRFAFPTAAKFALTWEDLLGFRHRGGLPGHAEMAGKTLFIKANTGPSGHGIPVAAGEALALKVAGAPDIRVFAIEGEGGLTPGSAHETKAISWGLGLSNLVFLVDWNDFGIDERRHSSVVAGTPQDWFGPYGWRVTGTEEGMEWSPVVRTVLDAARGANPGKGPEHRLVSDPQGARLRQVRRPLPRRPSQAALGRVLGRAARVHGSLRRDLPGRRRGCPGRPGRDDGRSPRQTTRRS